eukprot:m.20811 g.20811  ORF g.20811 m.20811 type:complete len:246 (-) comp8630_c0_seq1:176-913(-)
MPLPPSVQERLGQQQNNGNGRKSVASRRGRRQGSESNFEDAVKESMQEIETSHDVVSVVLSARLVRVKASCVLAEEGIDAVMTHIARVNDKALLVDFVPIIIKHISKEEEDGNSQQHLGGIFSSRFQNRRGGPSRRQQQGNPADSVKQEATLGACLDLMDLMEELLKSPYEEYVVAALNLLSKIIERWDTDFKATTSTQTSATLSARSIFMKLAPFISMVENLTVRKEPKLAKIATKLKKQLDLL